MEAAVRNVVKIETATEPEFQEQFIAAMAFPHAMAPSPHLSAVDAARARDADPAREADGFRPGPGVASRA